MRVTELPLRDPSPTAERILKARLRTAQLLYNQLVTELLRRDALMRESVEYRRLSAENLAAKVAATPKSAPRRKCKSCAKAPVPCAACRKKGTPKHTPSSNPRATVFATGKERNAAWKALRARFNLAGSYSLATFAAQLHKAQAHWIADEDVLPCTLIHELAGRAWEAYEPFLFRKKSGPGRRGKPRRRPFFRPLTSISSRSTEKNHGPLRFVDDGVEMSNGLQRDARSVVRLAAIVDRTDEVIADALALDDSGELADPIRQLRLGYRTIGERQRWFVQLVQGGDPYKKAQLIEPDTLGPVGVDLGSKHVAIVAPGSLYAENVRLNENVERALREGKAFERRRARAQDRSRRATNPDAFDEQGRYRKGARIKVRSKRFHALGAERREAARAAIETKRQQRNALANAIISKGAAVHLEDLRYSSWQAAGMGRSMLASTPGGLISALTVAAEKYGRDLVLIDARAAKLSQLCHACGACHKDPIRGSIESRLSTCECGRSPVQRDLYSAFLASFTDAKGTLDASQARGAWTGMSRSLGIAASSESIPTRQGRESEDDTAGLARATGIAVLNADYGPTLPPAEVAGYAGATGATSAPEAARATRIVSIHAASSGDESRLEQRGDDGLTHRRSTQVGRGSATHTTPIGDEQTAPPARSSKRPPRGVA